MTHRPWPVPDRPWTMRMRWRDLLFAHWAVDAAAQLHHFFGGDEHLPDLVGEAERLRAAAQRLGHLLLEPGIRMNDEPLLGRGFVVALNGGRFRRLGSRLGFRLKMGLRLGLGDSLLGRRGLLLGRLFG